MIINNENIADMKDTVDMLKRTTAIIRMIQMQAEQEIEMVDSEDIADALFLVWERQNKYIDDLENALSVEEIEKGEKHE